MALVTVAFVGCTSSILAELLACLPVLLLIIDDMCLLHIADLHHLTPINALRLSANKPGQL